MSIYAKLKQLSKDTTVYGISTILGRFLNFLLVPFYTYVFTRADYGIVANVYSFIALMNIFYIYGIDVAYLRYSTNQAPDIQKKNYSTAFLTVFFTSLILSFLILLTYKRYYLFVGIDDKHSYLIYYVLSIVSLDALAAIPFINLRLMRKAKIFAMIKFSNILVNVVLNIVLIKFYHLGIEAVFLSNLAASLITLLILFFDIKNNFIFLFDKQSFKQMFKFGIAFLPAGLASMIIQVIDRPILQLLTNLDTVGLYQANYKLGIFMMLFVSIFQYAWQPFLIANSQEKDSKQVISKVLTYFTVLGSLILIFLTYFIFIIGTTKIFGKSLIASAYWDGLFIVPIVLAGYLFNGVYVVLTAGMLIKEKTFLAPLFTGSGAIINVVANFLLIPKFGIVGAAFSTFLSYFVMSIMIYIANQKYYEINFEKYKLLKLFLLILAYLIIFYWNLNIIKSNILLPFLGVITFVVLIFVLKILNKDTVKTILRIK